MKWLVITFVLTLTWTSVQPYFITVDSHSEECFFDRVEVGTKMGLTFEIAEGGFLDIDVRILDPTGKLLYDGEQESSGKYTFAAEKAGEYKYCFSNFRGTMVPKVVMFNMDVSEAPSQMEGKSHEGDSNNAKLDDMIKELRSTLKNVKSDQEYMEVRDRNHRLINESTNFRVVAWSFFEATALVCMTLGQIYYLKRFFEVRRVV